MSYRPGLVWDGDTLVWENRTLAWENIDELPARLGNIVHVKRSRSRILKVKTGSLRRRNTD